MHSVLYVGNKLSHFGLTPGLIESLGPSLEKEGYRMYYAGTYKSQAVRLLEIIFKVISIGRNVDYILIDTYSTSAFWYANVASLVARVIGVPYIPLLHGGNLPRRLVKSNWASRSLFNNSYANVAVSGYLKHEFEERGYKVINIPNSIEIKNYPFKLRHKCRPLLLWVRSFHRQYNPNMAADVLSQLLRRYDDAHLCMVGPDKDGSMEEFRMYVAEKSLVSHVTITGKLSKQEWIALSVEYDFFINTTNVDNTPVSVIEAMALGMCVISTNPGGIPYLLHDEYDSILVQQNDSQSMAERIADLLKSPQSSSLLSTNARKSAEGFDWASVQQLWHTLLV